MPWSGWGLSVLTRYSSSASAGAVAVTTISPRTSFATAFHLGAARFFSGIVISGIVTGVMLSGGMLLSRSSSLPAAVFGLGIRRLLSFISSAVTWTMLYDPWYRPATIVA